MSSVALFFLDNNSFTTIDGTLTMIRGFGPRRLHSLAGAAVLICAIGFCGCSGEKGKPKMVPVSGSVKLKGAPVPNATVTFMPEGSAPRNPFGTTDKDGNFKLTSYDTDDGAVAGDYIVVIIPGASKDGKKPEERTPQDMISLGPGGKIENQGIIPAKYADRKTSGLKRAVVAGDSNVFNFDLKEE